MATGGSPFFPGFDLQRYLETTARLFQGPEQAMRVARELFGLEGGNRERAVDFVAQLSKSYGLDATLLFETVLRFNPVDTARVAAAAYLVEHGREDTVLEVLESLQPPVLTLGLVTGLVDALGSRPATPERVSRLIAFANRFVDDQRYTTLLLGDFGGRDVKRVVRRAIAESLLRRDAADAASWPRD